ncbi:hypothetical protein, partial [Streptomyces hydrogenans]|uniref:hypothetical protein n=1 Tax=Streptomyces hydrogenans TaxID=1873719 RepID=UPI003663083B
ATRPWGDAVRRVAAEGRLLRRPPPAGRRPDRRGRARSPTCSRRFRAADSVMRLYAQGGVRFEVHGTAFLRWTGAVPRHEIRDCLGGATCVADVKTPRKDRQGART